MNAAEQAALAFCSVLFADLDDDLGAHQVHILTLPGPSVRWFPVSDPGAIASGIVEANARPGVGAVYLSMGLAGPETAHRKPDGSLRRTTHTDIAAIGGVWADIDVAGPGHTKANLPPSEAEARKIVEAAGLRPTILWRSGGGLQAYWRFAEPLILVDDHARDQARELARNWNVTLAMHAHRLGRYQVDSVFDLTRVLRPPGTTNRKIEGDHRRVEIIYQDGPDYEPADVVEHTADQAWLDKFEGMTRRTDGKGTASLDLVAIWRMCNSPEYKARGYRPEWLEYALEGGVLGEKDRLVKVFEHGHESQDDSVTDASLARLCADLDLDERDAVEMVICRRLRHGRKLDKVDPRQRKSYLIMTVDKVFAEAKKKRERITGQTDVAAAAIAAQDAAAQRGAVAVPPPPDAVTRAAAATTGAHDLGGAVVAALGEASRTVVPDNDATPDDELPADLPEPPHEDAPAVDAPPPVVDDPADPEHPAEPLAAEEEIEPESSPPATPRSHPTDTLDALNGFISGPITPPQPVVDDAPAEPGPEPEPEPVVDTEPIPPPAARPITGGARSSWGTRSESQQSELDALTASLLGKAAGAVSIWRPQYRGRGARQERRLVLRVDPAYRWPAQPPEGYVPGLPLTTGWYPAGSFDKLGGWIKALRQDCLLITAPMSADEFSARFSDTLVRLWEPDTSGGSLANVTRDGMVSYLMDFPPMTEWSEAATQGMPLIIQDEPRWAITSRFTVLVRWSDFTRHVRTHFALNVTPAVAAEMAELSGSSVAQTRTQGGRWRAVRRDYLSEDEWTVILHGAGVAEAQRGDRHGMRVMPGGLADDAGQGPAPHRGRTAR